MNDPRTIKVRIVQHRHSDLMMAISDDDDLRGLMVPGRSEAEIRAKVPAAIVELLEAQGQKVSIGDLREDPDFPPDFMPAAYIADAHMGNR